jgi:S1-C subfamily serine protease
MGALAEIREAVQRAAEQVGPSVVGLGRGWGMGSGVVIGEGRVLTNAHNLRRQEISVTFADGRVATASVAGADVDGDLAVLAVDTGRAPALEWAPDAPIELGTPVVALANPGGRGLRATLGFVSATGRSHRGPRGRRIGGSIEHTAPLPRGSSGGPLVDEEGRLLGLNTVRLDGGLILAIAADAGLRARAEALWRRESPPRRTLGVAIAPAHVARRLRAAVGLPEHAGLLVRAVQEEGAAARAGIERGDLIVAAGGRPVATADDLYAAIDGLSGGADLALTLLRGAEERELVVDLDGGSATEG